MASGESFADGGPGRCLEPEEMLALASGERPAGPAGHVSSCERCRRAVEDVAARVRRPAARAQRWAPSRLPSCAPVSIALAVGMVLGIASVARRQCPHQAAPVAAAAEPAAPLPELETIDPALPSTSPPTNIAAVIRENTASIRDCYDRALKVGRLARSHRLDLQLRIVENGTVNRIQIIHPAPYRFAELHLCVRRAVRGWTFPPSDGAYEVEFPLIFQGG